MKPDVTTWVVYDGGVFLGPIFGDMSARTLRWSLCEGMTYQLIAQVPVLSSTSKGELPKSILCGISLMVTLTYWFVFPELVCLVTLKSCRLQLTKRVAKLFSKTKQM